MRVEAIRLRNFRAFRAVELRDIPGFSVFVGANGTGKSSLFSVFAFLRDAMSTNVTAALGRLGGSRGIQEVRSRGCEGPIEIELKIRADLGRSQPSLPGIDRVESKITEEGRVLLKFQDSAFEDPFLARYVSDGTIKMLAYLVLLLDPKPHPLLCVEEPENQLYPSLLSDLAEEFRSYATRGGQVLVSTHSPDFLNAVEIGEVFWLIKKDGYTEVRRGTDDAQLVRYMAEGDKLGFLWKQGLLEGADPR